MPRPIYVSLDESDATYWRAVWHDHTGKRRRKSLGNKASVSRRQALRKKTELAVQLGQRAGAAESERPPALASWKDTLLPRLAESKSRATVQEFATTFRYLCDYFSPNTRLDKVSRAEAHQFADWLRTMQPSKRKSRLSKQSVAKRLGYVKQVWKYAIRDYPVLVDPWEHVASTRPSTQTRPNYVSAREMDRILDACPNIEWRCLFALCRWAGVRFSEAMNLRWEHIEWDRGVFHVWPPQGIKSNKRRHRVVPMRPELAALLQEAMQAMPAGIGGPCFRLPAEPQGRAREIRDRANVPTPGKPLHDLRASCENEWRMRFPATEVAAWLGHSTATAVKHYHTPNPDLMHAVSRNLSTTAMPTLDDVDDEALEQWIFSLPVRDVTRLQTALNRALNRHEPNENRTGQGVVTTD